MSDIPESVSSIRVPTRNNILLKAALQRVNQDEELRALWRIANVNAIDRLGITDHGPVHVHLVANIALRITRILLKKQIPMSVVKDFHLSEDHAELIVFMTSLFHDLGMSIHRSSHEEFSVILANRLLHRMIDFLPSIEEKTIVISEILHAIISHRRAGNPFTIEGAIVRVADALDMSSGRSRIPFTQGKVDIHSLSASAIERVDIKEGKEKPVQIEIFMTNSAGIFQIDELLKEKLMGSQLEQYFQVKAYIKGQTEKKLLTEFSI
jgi:metal-dependent HD superfamily phosphatase/phosphodiesterase